MRGEGIRNCLIRHVGITALCVAVPLSSGSIWEDNKNWDMQKSFWMQDVSQTGRSKWELGFSGRRVWKWLCSVDWGCSGASIIRRWSPTLIPSHSHPNSTMKDLDRWTIEEVKFSETSVDIRLHYAISQTTAIFQWRVNFPQDIDVNHCTIISTFITLTLLWAPQQSVRIEPRIMRREEILHAKHSESAWRHHNAVPLQATGLIKLRHVVSQRWPLYAGCSFHVHNNEELLKTEILNSQLELDVCRVCQFLLCADKNYFKSELPRAKWNRYGPLLYI